MYARFVLISSHFLSRATNSWVQICYIQFRAVMQMESAFTKKAATSYAIYS